MAAYYNEIDPFAAQWLRNLITAGHIAPGEVDERSIEDVHPSDLGGFQQCHFFAGIGVWSLALRRAGWPDDRPIWTGSCPCQPFSAAGQGAGFTDERHLWPAFHWLIGQCRPAGVLGEQVASKDADPWIDLVSTDLEALGYSVGACAFPSAGVGAPHIRDRLYWMGYTGSARLEGHAGHGGPARWEGTSRPTAKAGLFGGLGDSHSLRTGRDSGAIRGSLARYHGQHGADHVDAPSGNGSMACEFCRYEFDAQRLGRYGCPNCEGEGLESNDGDGLCGLADTEQIDSGCKAQSADNAQSQANRPADKHSRHCSAPVRLADANNGKQRQGGRPTSQSTPRHESGVEPSRCSIADSVELRSRTGPVNGMWADADWIFCRDGKWRPVEPGTQPLVDATPSRVGRLRAYGNAINAQAAQVFIQAAMSCIDKEPKEAANG